MSEGDIEDKLEKLESNYEELEKAGRDLQEIGSVIVRSAVYGKRQSQFLKIELPKYRNITSSYPELKDHLYENESWISDAIDETNLALKGISIAGEKINQSLIGFDSTSASMATVGLEAITGISILEDKNPTIDFKKTYNLQEPKQFLEKLDSKAVADELSSYDADLEAMRQGAWKTFNSTSEARLSQAAHTMRDLLRLFITKYASNDDVKKAPWWEYDKKTKDGVSLKHRIRYLIYGNSTNYKPNNISFIEDQVKRFEEDYKLLSKVAHGKKSSDIAVESSMKSIEQLILLILQRRKSEKYG